MRALKDFPYWDHEQRRSVVIKSGERIDPERLTANKVDLEKLERTKYVVQGDEQFAPRVPRETGIVKRKRGRPRKQP